MNTWLDIKETQPAEGERVLVQTVGDEITVWTRVLHGRTRKPMWDNGSRYMDDELVQYWQPLPKPHKPAV